MFNMKNRQILVLLLIFFILNCQLFRKKNTDIPGFTLLITIDTWRWDFLGVSNESKLETPCIDELSKKGVYFNNAVTSTPLTTPSHASILTGLYPPHHGVRDNGRSRLTEELVTLAEIFQNNGYKTAAFVSAFPVISKFGFSQGFQDFHDELPLMDIKNHKFMKQIRGRQTVDRFKDWYKQNKEHDKLFVWVHFFDPHAPYEAPNAPPSDNRWESYGYEVSYVDKLISEIKDIVNDRNDVLWCIISDHGEALFDHGEETHGILLYRSTIQIPLILSGAGIRYKKNINNMVQNVDVLPTILDIVGLKDVSKRDGQSLIPLINGNSMPERFAYIESLHGWTNYGVSPLYGAMTSKWKFIHSSENELYDLFSDPGEDDNVLSSGHDETQEVILKLKTWSQKMFETGIYAPQIILDRETQKMLNALGYAGGSASNKNDDNKIDGSPREIITWMAKINRARKKDMMNHSSLLRERLFRQFIDKFPKNTDIRNELGLLWLEKGKFSGAASLFEKVIELDPLNVTARMNLGGCYMNLKNYEGAKEQIENVLVVDPDSPEALMNLGLICLQFLPDRECVKKAWGRYIELKPDTREAIEFTKVLSKIN